MDRERENLMRQIANLRAERQDRELALPAHSVRPHQLLVIEELENKIHQLEEKLRLLDSAKVLEEAK
jgi:hypothetical protein